MLMYLTVFYFFAGMLRNGIKGKSGVQLCI